MKIEIDTKELATLINMIREQRESVCNADSLAKEIKESLPQKISERLNLHTLKSAAGLKITFTVVGCCNATASAAQSVVTYPAFWFEDCTIKYFLILRPLF